jgi:hypothetical protein
MRKSSTARDENSRHRENPYGIGISVLAQKSDRCRHEAKKLASSTGASGRKSRRCVVSACAKNFFPQTGFRTHCAGHEPIKTSESVARPIRATMRTPSVRVLDGRPSSVIDGRLND